MTDRAVTDPTTTAITAQNEERDRLCAEVVRLTKIGDLMFAQGYDQAVREIRDHFKKAQMTDVVAAVETIWMRKPS